MEYDHQERDWENPRDDEDRRVGEFMRALAKVSHSEDKKIFWGLPVILAVFASCYIFPGVLDPLIVAVVGVGGIFGGLGWIVYSNGRRKREILIRHGLKCARCGHLPSAFMAGGVYELGRCPKCQNPLDLR